MFVRGAMAGAKIAGVVGVDSVCNRRHAALFRERVHAIEKFVLAVVAAVGVVCYVERIFEFRSMNKFVMHARSGR